MVTDSHGRPLGKYQTPVQPLRDDVEMIRKFLISIQKNRKELETMTEQKQEKTNMVYLAGKLKLDPKEFDKNTGCLIDTGQKSSIPCSIYLGDKAPEGNAALSRKLLAFREGDFIKVVAMVRPYGVKNDERGTWKNGLSIEITAIKNDPPRRQSSRPSDDDIPF